MDHTTTVLSRNYPKEKEDSSLKLEFTTKEKYQWEWPVEKAKLSTN